MKNQTFRMTMLFDFYGELLTDRQKEFYDLYYNEDLSLSEIGEHMGITRQGVRDNIKRGEHILFDAEEKLGLAQRFLGIKEKLEHIDGVIREVEQSDGIRYLPDNIKRKINEMLLMIEEMNEQL